MNQHLMSSTVSISVRIICVSVMKFFVGMSSIFVLFVGVGFFSRSLAYSFFGSVITFSIEDHPGRVFCLLPSLQIPPLAIFRVKLFCTDSTSFDLDPKCFHVDITTLLSSSRFLIGQRMYTHLPSFDNNFDVRQFLMNILYIYIDAS